MLKIDLNTGYGLFTNNNKILSTVVDTELDLPNNLYYNVLAYMLAFSYCCKQGKDATLDLNYLGGTVRVNGYGNSNGGLQVSGHLNIPTSAPSNPVKGDIWLVL